MRVIAADDDLELLDLIAWALGTEVCATSGHELRAARRARMVRSA